MFSYALIPKILKGFRERKGHIAFQTALLTTIGLYASCIAFISLNLIFSGIVCFINGTLWAILLIQKIIYK